MKQIAQEAQVSTTLVSQVLNNRDVRVAESTRERILRIAKQHNYIPNRLASGLKLNRTNTLAVLVPFTAVGFFSELIYHIEAYAMERGYISFIINTSGGKDKEEKALQLYKSHMMDGFIIAPRNAAAHQPHFEQIQADQFPFVFVDRYVDDVKATTISSDHYAIASGFVRWLIEKGHRRILFVQRLDEPGNSTIRSRMKAYVAMMESRGLSVELAGFNAEADNPPDVVGSLSGFPAADSQPDAIFLASGSYMPLLLRRCEQLGYDIKAIDFATVDGFMFPADFLLEKRIIDGIEANMHMVVQDPQTIAQKAVDALIDLIDGKEDGKEQIHVPQRCANL
ncbi:MAG TPA: LacI family DNA-binding transcriptional regulator [Rectinemataceae bacterium]|nr:LacI family DNA-binding transcriptional regulator [Rectinemataceae bacterium]